MKQFSEDEIIRVYQTYVNKPNEYYRKFECLPLELNCKKWNWDTKDCSRIFTILDFKEWLVKHSIGHFPKVLATCLTDPELEYITYDKIVVAEYINRENDLHTLDLPGKDFDFIILNQTLEHLYNPFICVENLYNHLKPGGYLFTSVPTINIPHLMPFHFNGYTPIGLCMLMKSAGFEVVETGFWGNLDYMNFMFQNWTWPNYKQLMKNGEIKNEPGRYVQTWILATK
jgi:SAM-dependent methyltransferase